MGHHQTMTPGRGLVETEITTDSRVYKEETLEHRLRKWVISGVISVAALFSGGQVQDVTQGVVAASVTSTKVISDYFVDKAEPVLERSNPSDVALCYACRPCQIYRLSVPRTLHLPRQVDAIFEKKDTKELIKYCRPK